MHDCLKFLKVVLVLLLQSRTCVNGGRLASDVNRASHLLRVLVEHKCLATFQCEPALMLARHVRPQHLSMDTFICVVCSSDTQDQAAVSDTIEK